MFRTGFVPLAAVVLVLLPLASLAQDCSSYNTSFSNLQTPYDTYQHSSKNHNGTLALNGSCTYTDQMGQTPCAIQCSTQVSGGATDEGGVSALYKHTAASSPVTGQAGSNGPSVTCGGQMAIAVRSCPFAYLTCDETVSISGSTPAGLGGSASYSSTPIWSPTLTYSYTCGSESYGASVCEPPPGGAPGVPEDGYTWEWDYTTCEWVEVPLGPSPIVIDTNGEGFHMTSAAEGVKFDFYGDGHPIQISWTARGSQNGWLALPDKDGKVTNARELFGNITAQYISKYHPRNGFAALAVYDNPSLGGNANGIIDPGDAIWSKLRVWIDANHDGISQSDELHTLDSLGIGHIDLSYLPSPEVDKYGNSFRFKGDLAAARPDDDVDRKIFDVFLVTK